MPTPKPLAEVNSPNALPDGVEPLREKAENICALTVGKRERNTLGVYRSRSGWKQQIVAPEKRGQPVIVLPPIESFRGGRSNRDRFSIQ